MKQSKIEWTQATWNPTTGCSKISQGCNNCYAEIMSRRLQAMGLEKYRLGFDRIVFHPQTLQIPAKWKKSRLIFVNSMSDLFHPSVKVKQIKEIFSVMGDCPHHIFQILTKRTERLLKMSLELEWRENIWMGTTVENAASIFRIDLLRQTGAKTRFLSFEPLLEPLPKLDLRGMDWVIVGGESGAGARPMLKKWVLPIRDHCRDHGIPFFFKQWGGVRKKENGNMLEGKVWNNWPKTDTMSFSPVT